MKSPCLSVCVSLAIGFSHLTMTHPVLAQRPPAAESTAASANWVAGEHSTGKRPIEVARFGNGSQFVLVVGSIAGNDPASIELLDATCQLAKQFPPPDPVTLLFVRTPNPDGLEDLVHTNSRGVELNRNFPTRNFTTAPNRLTGRSPGSEVETQYLLRILKEFKPVRVLHLHSGHANQPLVLVNGKWLAQTGPAVLPNDIPQDRYHEAFKAGSLEEFVSLEMQTSVGTVLLSTGARPMTAAEVLRLAVGKITNPSLTPDDLATSPGSGARGNSPSSMKAGSGSTFPEVSKVPAAIVGGKNEVQLLPPPPEFARTSRSLSAGDKKNERYIELPPPKR